MACAWVIYVAICQGRLQEMGTRLCKISASENIIADTVTKTLFTGWIAKFLVPLRITTDQGM